MAASDRVLLRVEGLSIVYGTSRGFHDAVKAASLTVRRGEFTALIGESGCGKTTFLRGLLGLLRSQAQVRGGTVSFLGRPLSPDEIRGRLGSHIGFIPQDPMVSLNPVRRIGRQMEEVFRLKMGLRRTEARRRCVRLLERVRLKDTERVLGSYPHQLSGGMAQRVVLAMAIALGPVFLAADEPTSALDAALRKDLLEEIRGLCRDGMGVLFVTHDLHLVARFADSIVVMKDGAIVETGDAHAVLEHPSHDYTRALVNRRSPA